MSARRTMPGVISNSPRGMYSFPSAGSTGTSAAAHTDTSANKLRLRLSAVRTFTAAAGRLGLGSTRVLPAQVLVEVALHGVLLGAQRAREARLLVHPGDMEVQAVLLERW